MRILALALLLLANPTEAVNIQGVAPGVVIDVRLTGGAALSSTVISIAGGLSTTLVHVDKSVKMPVTMASGVTVLLDSMVKSTDVVSAGTDDLFPMAFVVDSPLTSTYSDGRYAPPKLDLRGALYLNGGEVLGTGMASRGLGIVGRRAITGGVPDEAMRPMVVHISALDDLMTFNSGLDAGGWLSVSIPALVVNGLTDANAAYARWGGTTFTQSGITSFAAFVKVIDTADVDSVEDILSPSVTPTVFSATPYVAEGTVGDVMEFTTAVRVSGQGGFIHTVSMIDDAGQNAAMVIFFFDRAITPSPDTLPISISEGDMENYIGQVAFAAGNYESVGTGSSAMRSGLTIAFRSNATSIFAVMKTKGTPNYSATDDLTIKLGIGSD